MKINNSLKHPRWYDLKCKCNHDSVETEYPISSCLHCKFQEQEDSMPTENFKVERAVIDDKGKHKGKKTITIKELKIIRGKKYEEIIGWTY